MSKEEFVAAVLAAKTIDEALALCRRYMAEAAASVQEKGRGEYDVREARPS
jgi:hypothetical protein